MRQQFELLTSVPGIAEISALQLLGELAPAHEVSGSSIHVPSRISRAGPSPSAQRALSTCPRWWPCNVTKHMKAFYELLQSRHKAQFQTLIAVAGKLLHAIYGIFRSLTPGVGEKCVDHWK